MDTKHQKYELSESIGEDELIRNLKVKENYEKKIFRALNIH